MKKENSLELVGNKITHQRTTNATNIHKTKHCLSLKKLFSFFNWLAVLLMWGCAASVYIDPSIYGKYFSVIGLTFPIWAAAVLFMTVITLLFQPKMVWIPLVGFVGCYGSIRDYCPINLSSPPPKRAWKVMSYNTMSFGNWKKDEQTGEYEVARYICSQQPDIACLQEIAFRNDEDHEMVQRTVKNYKLHIDWSFVGGSKVGVISKFPIVKNEMICHSECNGAVAFYLTPKAKDTLVVVCAHLESMRLSKEERSNYKEIVENPEQIDEVHGKLSLIKKIATGGKERAFQTDTLMNFLDKHAHNKIILMGDFNDTPISYAHHMMCSRLTDAYRATGNGIGRSFNKDAIYVRIDNIFCSSHFKPYAVKVDDSVPFSDHYPIIGYLKEQ